MKANSNSNSTEETSKSAQSKLTKKSTKSRSKSKTTEANNRNVGTSANSNSTVSNTNTIISNSNSIIATATVYPSTPKTITVGNAFDSPTTNCSNNTESSSNSRSHHKSYAGLDPRSIKIIWEQHDQSDVELSSEVCARVAEDASYKLWELINNVKTYSRHSGGVATYDIVNEVMRDADVPPTLGAMYTDWDRIDYDGSYFFYSDKVIELRDEYQKDVTIKMPAGPDFLCTWPVEEENVELLKKYIPSITYVSLYGDSKALDEALTEAAFSPIMGSCHRVFLAKLIQILAFKQNDPISVRCWSLLRALTFNPYTRDVDCREEYFHLAEILICQLLAPYETIKVHGTKVESQMQDATIKMEIDDIKHEIEHEVKNEFTEDEMFQAEIDDEIKPHTEIKDEEKIYKLQPDNDCDDENDTKTNKLPVTSPYFASPVDWQHVDDLCQTIGQLAASNGFFQNECLFLVLRRLERFFDGRHISTERDFNYISRVVRGLICLGEYSFREIIPFLYKFSAEKLLPHLWNDFSTAALFLKGSDDIFLYEWLENLCGADKLQPFLVYYAHYHEKLLTYRFIHRKRSTYKICPKIGVRRLEWSTLAAAMCHGDDPNKALKPKPAMNDYFPDIISPNLKLNRAGTIRFKFAGCRPVIIKPKVGQTKAKQDPGIKLETLPTTSNVTPQKDILIARRKLYKPLTNERRVVPVSSYYFLRI